jgi:hypothetical protein
MENNLNAYGSCILEHKRMNVVRSYPLNQAVRRLLNARSAISSLGQQSPGR